MFEWLKHLFCFPWPNHNTVPEPETPLLLVPGICGTQLDVRERTSNNSTNGKRVWVCIEHADNEYKRLWGRVPAGEKHLHLLDQNLEVVVPENPKTDDGGLYSIDVLDPSLHVPIHVIYYYHSFIWYLRKQGYTPGKSLFGFGYDFRQSNMIHLDALQEKLEAISKAKNGAKVDVITHSMGGLVVRSFLAARPQAFQRLVRKWIAIASPFGGAPGFSMDALLTGVQFCEGWEQYFFVNRTTMHTMTSQAPAVFELLPDPLSNIAWPRGHQAPVARVVIRKSAVKGGLLEGEEEDVDGGGIEMRSYRLSDFRDLLGESLKGYQAETYNGEKVTMEMNPECWKIADDTCKQWRGCSLPEGCQFFNLFGTGFKTAYNVTYGTLEAPLESLTDLAGENLPVKRFSHVEGDGTVPVCCATADGLPAVERQGFFAQHRGLLELPAVWECVMKWIDLPTEASVPDESSALFPQSHKLQEVRAAHMARLRPEADERTQRFRTEWFKAGEPMPGWENAKTEVLQAELFYRPTAGRAVVDSDWLLLEKRDVPEVCETDVIANPLLKRW